MTRSIKKIAAIVTVGTLLSKAGGMIRQLTIAWAFGISSAYDAYNYAYILPGFFLVIIGGSNGPLHNSIVTTLASKNTSQSRSIINSLNTLIGLILLVTSIIIFLNADLIIRLVGPALNKNISDIAIIQLKIMSPVIFLSGIIGISFGTLNAKDEFFIPSIAPLLSSLTICIFLCYFWATKNNTSFHLNIDTRGGIFIASATLLGALAQYLIQIPSLIKKRLFSFKLTFNIDTDVKQAIGIVIPATLSSSMLQINVFTDLIFASIIKGAASGLSYATFLIQAPLGIISNGLLIPLLPNFSQLIKQNKYTQLTSKIQQSLMLSSILMVALGTIFISLASPIVRAIYARGSFDNTAIILVSQLLIAYGFGMPAYLGRDLLVRVFYGMKDSKTPLKISAIGIILNVIFDWILLGANTPSGNLLPINCGASGLVIATMIVNILTCSFLLLELKKKIRGLDVKKLLNDHIKLILTGLICGSISWILSNQIIWGNSFPWLLSEIIICSCSCLTIFIIISKVLKIDEINYILWIGKNKINLL